MKKTLSLLLLLLLLMASCKPTSSIITSKQRAIDLNIYKPILTENSKSEKVNIEKFNTTAKKFGVEDEKAIVLPNSNGGIDEFESSEKITYRAENADFRNELMSQCFAVCEINGIDIYDTMSEVALKETGMDKFIPLPSTPYPE